MFHCMGVQKGVVEKSTFLHFFGCHLNSGARFLGGRRKMGAAQREAGGKALTRKWKHASCLGCWKSCYSQNVSFVHFSKYTTLNGFFLLSNANRLYGHWKMAGLGIKSSYPRCWSSWQTVYYSWATEHDLELLGGKEKVEKTCFR